MACEITIGDYVCPNIGDDCILLKDKKLYFKVVKCLESCQKLDLTHPLVWFDKDEKDDKVTATFHVCLVPCDQELSVYINKELTIQAPFEDHNVCSEAQNANESELENCLKQKIESEEWESAFRIAEIISPMITTRSAVKTVASLADKVDLETPEQMKGVKVRVALALLQLGTLNKELIEDCFKEGLRILKSASIDIDVFQIRAAAHLAEHYRNQGSRSNEGEALLKLLRLNKEPTKFLYIIQRLLDLSDEGQPFTEPGAKLPKLTPEAAIFYANKLSGSDVEPRLRNHLLRRGLKEKYLEGEIMRLLELKALKLDETLPGDVFSKLISLKLDVSLEQLKGSDPKFIERYFKKSFNASKVCAHQARILSHLANFYQQQGMVDEEVMALLRRQTLVVGEELTNVIRRLLDLYPQCPFIVSTAQESKLTPSGALSLIRRSHDQEIEARLKQLLILEFKLEAGILKETIERLVELRAFLPEREHRQEVLMAAKEAIAPSQQRKLFAHTLGCLLAYHLHSENDSKRKDCLEDLVLLGNSETLNFTDLENFREVELKNLQDMKPNDQLVKAYQILKEVSEEDLAANETIADMLMTYALTTNDQGCVLDAMDCCGSELALATQPFWAKCKSIEDPKRFMERIQAITDTDIWNDPVKRIEFLVTWGKHSCIETSIQDALRAIHNASKTASQKPPSDPNANAVEPSVAADVSDAKLCQIREVKCFETQSDSNANVVEPSVAADVSDADLCQIREVKCFETQSDPNANTVEPSVAADVSDADLCQIREVKCFETQSDPNANAVEPSVAADVSDADLCQIREVKCFETQSDPNANAVEPSVAADVSDAKLCQIREPKCFETQSELKKGALEPAKGDAIHHILSETEGFETLLTRLLKETLRTKRVPNAICPSLITEDSSAEEHLLFYNLFRQDNQAAAETKLLEQLNHWVERSDFQSVHEVLAEVKSQEIKSEELKLFIWNRPIYVCMSGWAKQLTGLTAEVLRLQNENDALHARMAESKGLQNEEKDLDTSRSKKSSGWGLVSSIFE